MTLAASSQHLHHRCLLLHDATNSKAPQTGISLRPPMHQALSFCSQEGKLWVQGSSTRLELAAALGVRLVARCAGEAFSSPGASPGCSVELARESEAAEPQRGFPTR